MRQTGWLRCTVSTRWPLQDATPHSPTRWPRWSPSRRWPTLRPLHLTDCTFDARDGRWTLAIVPFGGSEVVNRMPSFRRYVRLTGEQAAALSAACLAFETALRRILHG